MKTTSSFAALPAVERQELLEVAADRFALPAIIIEKDFWVVWLLGRIFDVPELGDSAVFKGGTSLSKVFGVIARFSEDVDLGISPASLGWDEGALVDASKNRWTEKLRPQLEADCARRVETGWLPRLEAELVSLWGRPRRGGVGCVSSWKKPATRRSFISTIRGRCRVGSATLLDR